MTSIVEMVGKLLSSSSESKWKRKLCFCSYRLNQWTQWLPLFRCSTDLTQSWTLCQSVSWPDYISKYRSHLKMKDSRFIITSTVLPIYLESHHCTLEQMLYGVSWSNHALVRIPHSSLFPFLKQHHIVIGIWPDLILYLQYLSISVTQGQECPPYSCIHLPKTNGETTMCWYMSYHITACCQMRWSNVRVSKCSFSQQRKRQQRENHLSLWPFYDQCTPHPPQDTHTHTPSLP